VKEILTRESILGYTSHRFWDEGKRYKESDPQYQDSYWMKGISMTRDLNYGINWGSVVLVFDRDLMRQNHKIESYSWNHHFKDFNNHKKEREEFVVLSKDKKRFQNQDNPEWIKECEDIMSCEASEDFDAEELQKLKEKFEKKKKCVSPSDLDKPAGEFKFGESLVGIYLRGGTVDIYGPDDETIQCVLNHSKFIGILDD
jgi:hypothetical protein